MLTALLLAPLLLGADEPKYARPELLMEPAALLKSDKRFRVVDVRIQEKYTAGHVPGAVWVDASEWGKLFATSTDAETWGAKLGELAIELDTPVVVYDDGGVKEAARIWWILRYWGMRDVRLLNGGWAGWNGPVSTEIPNLKSKTLMLAAEAGRHASKQRMLDLLKNESFQVIDARSEREVTGELKLAKRAGQIPGAVNLDWAELIDPATRRFKSAAELTRILEDAGIDMKKGSVTYCQSGGRAAVMAFALELMGVRDVCNYYRSWAEWGNVDDTPIQVRKK